MIGVLTQAGQLPIASEFFELFKTPWEPYRSHKHYDVVISTDGEVPSCTPRLLIMYGSTGHASDELPESGTSKPPAHVATSDSGLTLPIYGQVRLFPRPEAAYRTVLQIDSRLAAYSSDSAVTRVVRVGYHLFDEIGYLLSSGQEADHSRCPTVEVHIAVLRGEILAAGLPLLELPPVPAGYRFLACLTHDIDFVGIKRHKFDHTMWGFLYRSTVKSTLGWVTGRLSFARLCRIWRAAASLPLVYLGLARDFWLPFEWYFRVEKDLPATYFLIPFKNRPGRNLTIPDSRKRASKYDVTEIGEWTTALVERGFEIGVHGIDSWHDLDAARAERQVVADSVQIPPAGVRMHWLLLSDDTYRVLDEAGFTYDSTAGYNSTIGYRCGTTQVFRPLSAERLLELPLHLQDGALFYPTQLGLTEPDAWQECQQMIGRALTFGGVLTILWHDRSHAPERLWGDFYIRLIACLRENDAWFGNASEVVEWFRKRRSVQFRETVGTDGTLRIVAEYAGAEPGPPLTVRAFPAVSPTTGSTPRPSSDVSWGGTERLEFHGATGELIVMPRASASA